MNTQVFQSVYVNPDAKDPSDALVFHEPMFDSGPVGVTVLKTARLEAQPGLVFTGSKESLLNFRNKVENQDKNGDIGKLSLSDTVEELVALSDECHVKVYYTQNLVTDGELTAFFDPLTKRRLVQLGPAYFDPSLNFDKKTSRANGSLFRLLASTVELPSGVPSTICFPQNLNADGQALWQAMFRSYRSDVQSGKSVEEKWNIALEIFVGLCQKHSIQPYFRETTVDDSKLQEEIEHSLKLESAEFQKLYNFLKGRGLINASRTVPNRSCGGIKELGGKYFLCTNRQFQLSGLGTMNQICDEVCEEFKWYNVQYSGFGAAVKQLTGRSSLAIVSKLPQTFTFGLCVLLDKKELSTMSEYDLNAVVKKGVF